MLRIPPPPVPAGLAFALLSLLPLRPGVAAAASPPPTAEALVRTVRVSDPEISPDGIRVAFVGADSLDPGLFQIWMVDADGSGPPLPFTAGGRSARMPRWSPDGSHLLFLTARADTASEQVQIIAMNERMSRPLTTEPQGVIDLAWSPDGKRVAYLAPGAPAGSDPADMSQPPPAARLRVLDLDTGIAATISPDTVHVWSFTWSPDGGRLAVLFTRPGRFGEWRRGRLAVVRSDGSRWTPAPGLASPLDGAAFAPDSRHLAWFALPADTLAYPMLTVGDDEGRRARPLFDGAFPSTFTAPCWTEGGLYVLERHGVESAITRLEVTFERGVPRVAGLVRVAPVFGDAPAFSIATGPPDGPRAAFVSEGLDHPADVFALRLIPEAPPEPERLTRMNPQLDQFQFAAARPVTWTSFDGRRVEGLLMIPPDSGPPYPLVVYPHGGPSYQYSLGFLADPHNSGQYLAGQGYAVFFPNPRGSTGYGLDFNALNRRDLGGGDFRDIEIGVDSLVAAGLADPARLAIAGFSYGGYMTAWAISHTDRYTCAVIGAGPVDLLADYYQNDLTPYWQREFIGGTPWQDPRAYTERSPISFVTAIRTPVLIVHGSEDRRVPPAQSREMYIALRELGRPVEFYLYPGEGHGFDRPGHQIDFMKRELGWLDAHLKPVGHH